MQSHCRLPGVLGLAVPILLAGCGGTRAAEAPVDNGAPSPMARHCEPDNGGITLPGEFCAILVVDSLGPARHLDVADNGDLFVALRNRRARRRGPVVTGGVVALRDTDDDGHPDVRERWGENGGNDVLLAEGAVYLAPDDAVLRYPIQPGAMVPSGLPDTVVSALPNTRRLSAAPRSTRWTRESVTLTYDFFQLTAT